MDVATSTAIGPSADVTDFTVFIVDGDKDTRQAISLIVRSAGYADETFASAQEFLDRYDGRKPGCLVLDIQIPDMSGLELQHVLQLRDHQPPMIFVTADGDIPLITRAIRDGAVDVIPKPFNAESLLTRICEALQLDLVNRRKRAQADDTKHRISSLTERECEVMCLLAAGDSAKQIAQKLSISPKTVDNHRAKILDKMGVDNPTQLARQLVLIES